MTVTIPSDAPLQPPVSVAVSVGGKIVSLAITQRQWGHKPPLCRTCGVKETASASVSKFDLSSPQEVLRFRKAAKAFTERATKSQSTGYRLDPCLIQSKFASILEIVNTRQSAPPMASNDDLYKLIEHFCTAEQVKVLLRDGKRREDKDVRVTAETKTELIQHNLRSAVDAKIVPVEEVFSLLRNAEENGRQHIQFYKVPKRLADALTMDHVGKLLWGDQWAAKNRFPQIALKKNDFIYADFRQCAPERKPRDWVLKVLAIDCADGWDSRERRNVHRQPGVVLGAGPTDDGRKR